MFILDFGYFSTKLHNKCQVSRQCWFYTLALLLLGSNSPRAIYEFWYCSTITTITEIVPFSLWSNLMAFCSRTRPLKRASTNDVNLCFPFFTFFNSHTHTLVDMLYRTEKSYNRASRIGHDIGYGSFIRLSKIDFTSLKKEIF